MEKLHIPCEWPVNKEQIEQFAAVNSIHNFIDLAQYQKQALEEAAKNDPSRCIVVKEYCKRLKNLKKFELANQIYALLKEEKLTFKEASSILEITKTIVIDKAMEKII